MTLSKARGIANPSFLKVTIPNKFEYQDLLTFFERSWQATNSEGILQFQVDCSKAGRLANQPSTQTRMDSGLDAAPDASQANAPKPGQTEPQKQSRMISKVLAPAVRLWLRSQVEQVEDLQLQIEAGDRQIFSGCIQHVSLSARKAIYQGLHLSEVHLTGENIRVNLGQVVRGKPLCLLEPVPVSGRVRLQQADLNASLTAPLLANGVKEFLLALLRSGSGESALAAPDLNLQNLQIVLQAERAILSASLVSASGTVSEIAVLTGFELASPHQLKLVNPQWLPHAKAKRGLPLTDLNGYIFELGTDTEIQHLTLEAGQVTCQANLLVSP